MMKNNICQLIDDEFSYYSDQNIDAYLDLDTYTAFLQKIRVKHHICTPYE